LYKIKKIIITAGGTGGHVNPAISLIESLIRSNNRVVFISDNRVKKIILQNKGIRKNKLIKLYFLNISKSFKRIFSNFLTFINIFVIFFKEKPDLIIGFGGYSSFFSLIAAKFFLKPIILHEQNIIIGLTNKLFLPFSRKIILGLGEKKDFKFVNNKKYEFIRNPVRKKIIDLRNKVNFKFKKDKIIILIIGGSQGAKSLGTIFPETISLMPKIIKEKIYVYHQCSNTNINEVKNMYVSLKLKANCKTFFENLPAIMFKSHFVISRAGASSLSEIITLGKAGIIIPYKFAKYNHQLINANWFVKKGAGHVLKEDKLKTNILKKILIDFICNEKKLLRMSKESFKLGDPNSLKKILEVINNLKK